ncbi:16S rRNA (guanine(527)-N(7))-methyltransferase RsmG [Sphingomicrobium nitratireducens]|uniref:16S rRNA (guanine(527)-N(7))-methyltransferase RsmG n=1 Tax=Sphingomicrobium nitratireducens TaxID=2964666 RepID=UPI00223F0D17|nr:16S rRNA (guanine(527)-N(7))-methyltransferase RsmG [Sphingomicrobium nitratireducens]
MLLERLRKVSGRDVSRETIEKIEAYKSRLLIESEKQNLIARSTYDEIDERHIVDGAQLLAHDPRPDAHWVDIGSGAGLPGIVIAAIHPGPVTLVEPRKLRADFLIYCVDLLSFGDRVRVVPCRSTTWQGHGDVITGRAVAPIDKFFRDTIHLATRKTQFVLPKGRKAQEELEAARKVWQGDFALEPSATDGEAAIVLARNVRRRGKA